eukprot:6457647-Amphidinium_carterae.1
MAAANRYALCRCLTFNNSNDVEFTKKVQNNIKQSELTRAKIQRALGNRHHTSPPQSTDAPPVLQAAANRHATLPLQLLHSMST